MLGSDAAKAMIRRFEKCPLTAYQDPGGVWTIGVGHIGPDVVAGLTITQSQADVLFESDLAGRAQHLTGLVPTGTTQGQFDACLSLAFNIGTGAFADSTLLKLLHAGEPYAAALELQSWIH